MAHTQVKKMQSIVVDGDYKFTVPVEMVDKTRYSQCKGPLIQTAPLPICPDASGSLTILCSEEYADFLQGVDDLVIDTLSSNSQEWFGKHIRSADIESLIKPSIKGHRCPKHVVNLRPSAKCYDSELNLCDTWPTDQFSGVVILQITGIKIDEKRCEVDYCVHQVKKQPEAASMDEVNLDQAAFVA